jgi:hypothetical protein
MPWKMNPVIERKKPTNFDPALYPTKIPRSLAIPTNDNKAPVYGSKTNALENPRNVPGNDITS